MSISHTEIRKLKDGTYEAITYWGTEMYTSKDRALVMEWAEGQRFLNRSEIRDLTKEPTDATSKGENA